MAYILYCIIAIGFMLLAFALGFLLGYDMNHKKPIPEEFDEEEYNEFADNDRQNVQAMMSSLASLNEFMTGEDYEKEINNVGTQG